MQLHYIFSRLSSGFVELWTIWTFSYVAVHVCCSLLVRILYIL